MMQGDASGWRDVTTGISIQAGFAPMQREDVARIYWQAFGSKLGRVLGPDAKARAFLMQVMQPDHCLCAVDRNGKLLGVAGFKTHRGTFAGGSGDDMRSVYGRIGGAIRFALFAALSREAEDQRFLMDGLCVAPEARGRGVGHVLLAAIYGEAIRRGYSEVRLDVVDSNTRARALYEREGFRAINTVGIGPLRLFFGFRSATTMVRPVVPAETIAQSAD